MYITSSEYKENQSSTYREVYYEIEYGQIDPDARDTAQVDLIDEVTVFAKPEEILNDRSISNVTIIGTLEQDQFLLDGSRVFTPETPPTYEVGAWSEELSDADGNCNFYVQVKTDDLINCYGLTFTFYKLLNEYAVDFDIILKDNATVIKTIEVRNNDKAFLVVDEEITNCNIVRIEFRKWNKPFRYQKITQLDFGVYTIFNPDNLTSMRMQNIASAVSENLPFSVLNFKFVNDGNYDPIFSTGKNAFVRDRQPIALAIGSPSERIMSYFELSGKPNVTIGEVEINATSLFVKLNREQPVKWVVGKSLYDIAEEIMIECEVVDYAIDDILKSMNVTCLIKENYRDTIVDLLIASQCVMLQRNNVVCIERMSTIHSGYTIEKNVSDYPKVNIEDDIKKVIIYKQNYMIKPSEQITTFVAPYTGDHIIEISYAKDITITGGSLLYAWINAIKVTATESAEIVITGKLIESIETKHEYGTGSMAKEIRDNPFITDPEAVANWVLGYHSNRQNITTHWRQDNAIELLDILTMESDYGNIQIVVEEQTFDFDGGFKGTTKGRLI